MKQSPQIQARINAIAKDIAAGKTEKLVEKFGKKWNLKKTAINNYIKEAKPIAKKLSDLANKAATDTFIEETKEAVKNGIRTKNERIIILQREVDKIILELEANVTVDYVFIRGKYTRKEKEISVTDRAYLRKTLKDLQSEISKIEGDYAPEQSKGEMILTWQENKTYQKK